MKGYLSQHAYKSEVMSFRALTARGIHTVGPTHLVRFVPQVFDKEQRVLSAYACVDLVDVRVVDSKDKDVTPSSRPNRQTFLPSFTLVGSRVVLKENGTWRGNSIC